MKTVKYKILGERHKNESLILIYFYTRNKKGFLKQLITTTKIHNKPTKIHNKPMQTHNKPMHTQTLR